MTMLALHRSNDTSLATDSLLLTPEEATASKSAVGLLERLQQQYSTREARFEDAVAKIREAGYAAGREEALRSVAEELLANWEKAADQSQANIDTMRTAVVTLALQVVERIAAEMASADVVVALAMRAAEQLIPSQPAVLRVPPDVVAAVRSQLAIQGCHIDQSKLEVRADPTLSPCECVFDTPNGQLLAGLRTQLHRLARSLIHGDGRMDSREA